VHFARVYQVYCLNLDINRLPSFEPVSNPEFGRFLLETKTMGLEMGICSFSFTGAILP
jgi:hypothetical protein